MGYVDYSYYTTDYLLGVSPVIPEDVFLYWEKQASVEVDKRTYDRLKASPSLVIDSVRDCVCEIAELLYLSDKLSKQALEQGGGMLSSFSNDGESGTYDLSQSIYTISGAQSKTKEIIYRYLSHTGLLYAGVG